MSLWFSGLWQLGCKGKLFKQVSHAWALKITPMKSRSFSDSQPCYCSGTNTIVDRCKDNISSSIVKSGHQEDLLMTLWLPRVTKTELLLTMSIHYQADIQVMRIKIQITNRELLVDPIPISHK